jgi:GNAT superfamily N-acetyltransferase
VGLYKGKPVAFLSVIGVHFKLRYNRIARLVVLPDYQGVGIGKRLLEFVAAYYHRTTTIPFFIITSNPQLVHSKISNNWTVMRVGRARATKTRQHLNAAYTSASRKRLTISLKYAPRRAVEKTFQEWEKYATKHA